MSKKSDSQQTLDNHANQLNHEHPAYWLSRGLSLLEAEQAAREARTRAAQTPADPGKPKAE
ncbi:MAG TPA: hypothetical protein VM694_39555 [Polyangium sp.]|nr:hypothetical protein [Polyangium sp.]